MLVELQEGNALMNSSVPFSAKQKREITTCCFDDNVNI